jgi:uncharacterized protein (TIGR00255 family)
MLKSMTAYGRASEKITAGSLTVEIQSVNRKHLDIKVHGPAELRRFEIDIQNWISESVLRGQVTVKINLTFEGQSPVSVSPNIELARQIKTSADEIARELGIEDPHFSTRLVAGSKDILNTSDEIKDEKLWKQELKNTLGKALKPYSEMKLFEGQKLYEDFKERIDILARCIEAIDKFSERSTEAMRKKLTDTLDSVLSEKIEKEEALLREVCLYAEKVDISEEIIRFKAHLEHFKTTMEMEGSLGKTLDFIGQELFREVNTIASKAADIEISRKTIEIKTELERIREQLQNVE